MVQLLGIAVRPATCSVDLDATDGVQIRASPPPGGPMLRVGLALFLGLHGLLHLLGFAKAWALLPLPEVSTSDLVTAPRWQRAIGLLWVAACAGEIISAALLLAGVSRWWMVASAVVVLSQLLIIGAWSTARAGTVANILLIPPLVLAAAMSSFQNRSDAMTRELLGRAAAGRGAVVASGDVALLPAPVKRWLEGAGVVGRARARSVRLWQRGALRTSPGGMWMPAKAQQSFTVDEPGFVWNAHVTMLWALPVVGRDSYGRGEGRMVIKLGGLIPMVDARGPKIDQGTMLRFLGEIVWFPSAALSPYLQWTAVGPDAAKATMSYGGTKVSAVFTFDPMGRVLGVAADRYQGAGEEATLKRWEVTCRAWRRMGDDILVPVEGSVVWKEPAGDFEYFRWEITHIETDPRALR